MTSSAHDPAAHDPFDRDYWEERYGAPGFTWSGNPNPVLVAETAGLAPGRALDVGSGEGGDAIWLASRGWSVTGVDISQNALDKAQARAAEVGVSIAWEQHDLRVWTPEPEASDLVSAQFMHLAAPARRSLFRALAAAVAPGGTLLIVGHDAADLVPDQHNAHHRELMFTADDVLADIAGEGLSVQLAESRLRAAAPVGGDPMMMRDVVVRATRA